MFRPFLQTKWLIRWVVALAFLCGWPALVFGQASAAESTQAPLMEPDVKAAFILNFVEFIEWDNDAFDEAPLPIRIGIMGEGPMNDSLRKLDGEVVRQKTLKVSRVNTIPMAGQYHMIFVNPSEKRRVPYILRILKGTGTLTVADMPGFAKGCGMINFYLQGKRVRFEANLEALRRENLKVNPQLLRLARIIHSPCD